MVYPLETSTFIEIVWWVWCRHKHPFFYVNISTHHQVNSTYLKCKNKLKTNHYKLIWLNIRKIYTVYRIVDICEPVLWHCTVARFSQYFFLIQTLERGKPREMWTLCIPVIRVSFECCFCCWRWHRWYVDSWYCIIQLDAKCWLLIVSTPRKSKK